MRRVEAPSARRSFVTRWIRSLVAASVVLGLPGAPVSAAEDEEWTGDASGRIESRDLWFEVGDAYAVRAKPFFDDASEAIRVAVNNARFNKPFLDRYWDRPHFINEYFTKRDDVYVMWLEFTPGGEFRGISYYLEPGNGCGWCSSSEARSTVALTNGRLVGKVTLHEDDRSVDVTLDVPVASDDRGAAQGAGGGAPGKAYVAFHEALLARDAAALRKLFAARRLEHWREDEAAGRGDRYLDAFLEEHHAETLKVREAYVKGDEALVLVQGEHRALGSVKGEALLRRENGEWRFLDEVYQLGAW